jgi:hypothetical protein
MAYQNIRSYSVISESHFLGLNLTVATILIWDLQKSASQNIHLVPIDSLRILQLARDRARGQARGPQAAAGRGADTAPWLKLRH